MKNRRVIFAAVLLAIFSLCLLTACDVGGGTSSGSGNGSVVALSETQLSLTVGSSVSLTATGSSPFTWTSSNDNIASVDNGTVKAKAVGSAVITVTDEKGGSCTCNVTVADKEITKLTLDTSNASLEVGKTIQLTASRTPADATNVSLTWTSTNESVAVVNSDGYVTGAAEGVANIVCKAPNGIEASCTVTVKKSSSSSSSSSSAASSQVSSKVDTPPYRQPDNAPYGHFNPSYNYNAADFVFPESSTRQLTTGEIIDVLNNITGEPISGSYAQDAINEIYARNGYCFRDEKIRNYYEAQPWYYADESFSTSDFNSIENYNINLLLEYTSYTR